MNSLTAQLLGYTYIYIYIYVCMWPVLGFYKLKILITPPHLVFALWLETVQM